MRSHSFPTQSRWKRRNENLGFKDGLPPLHPKEEPPVSSRNRVRLIKMEPGSPLIAVSFGSESDRLWLADMIDVTDELRKYKIIKEGEAEILMHSNNTVFFNKAQVLCLCCLRFGDMLMEEYLARGHEGGCVYNRDMSIAVLRTYIAKRKEEHDAYLSKKGKSEKKGFGEQTLWFYVTEDISKECIKTPFWKDPRELKAPRVLEALAASGLRALRYGCEVDGIGQVIALDNDKGIFILMTQKCCTRIKTLT
ncbi:hypothetical protein BHE74_00016799 [Ensete ventricosum]|nr:hypothetical protein BHE74_00016799 [Ensete ventricosum]